jgi:hypothetical protein
MCCTRHHGRWDPNPTSPRAPICRWRRRETRGVARDYRPVFVIQRFINHGHLRPIRLAATPRTRPTGRRRSARVTRYAYPRFRAGRHRSRTALRENRPPRGYATLTEKPHAEMHQNGTVGCGKTHIPRIPCRPFFGRAVRAISSFEPGRARGGKSGSIFGEIPCNPEIIPCSREWNSLLRCAGNSAA